jgi:hypothetical protein
MQHTGKIVQCCVVLEASKIYTATRVQQHKCYFASSAINREEHLRLSFESSQMAEDFKPFVSCLAAPFDQKRDIDQYGCATRRELCLWWLCWF